SAQHGRNRRRRPRRDLGGGGRRAARHPGRRRRPDRRKRGARPALRRLGPAGIPVRRPLRPSEAAQLAAAGRRPAVRTDRARALLLAAIPRALGIFLVLLASLPWGLPQFAMLSPMLGLISVYHWTVHRPDLMPVAGAFAVGLSVALLSGGPLGLNAFVLTLVHAVTRAN